MPYITKYEKIRTGASTYFWNPLFPASIATKKLWIAIIIVFFTYPCALLYHLENDIVIYGPLPIKG
jgi:ABC-type multidrug transport system permease subunit